MSDQREGGARETPGQLLQRAQAVLDAQDATPQAAQAAVRDLWRCRAALDASGALSAGAAEEQDNVATADLPLLALPALLAAALPGTAPGPGPARLAALEAALAELQLFWRVCEQYSLLDAAAAAAVNNPPGGRGQGARHGATRERKVARFRLERAYEQELREAAVQRRRRGRRWRGPPRPRGEDPGGASDDDELAAGAEEEEGEEEGEEEERARHLALVRLRLTAVRSADSGDVLRQEIELLRHKEALESGDERGRDPRERPREGDGDAEQGQHTEEMLAQLRLAADALTRGERQRAREDVFRPGHNLPTMTLAEFAEREMQGAAQRTERAQRAEAARAAAAAGDPQGDAELARQRAWDDWRDDHPAGSGNSRLRPTA